jgi:hypothetical protein
VDAHDPESLSRWWRDALGWVVVYEDPEEFEIRASAGRVPGLLFAQISEPKVSKNRAHLDSRPDNATLRSSTCSRLERNHDGRADLKFEPGVAAAEAGRAEAPI